MSMVFAVSVQPLKRISHWKCFHYCERLEASSLAYWDCNFFNIKVELNWIDFLRVLSRNDFNLYWVDLCIEMTELPILVLKIILPLNPSTAEWALSALIDFTLSNARRFYSSMENRLDGEGLIIILDSFTYKYFSGIRIFTCLSEPLKMLSDQKNSWTLSRLSS